MKILLSAVNAKFIHSSLAIRCLYKFADKYKSFIKTKEYTINNNEDFILEDIYKENPNVVCFSCYIWNINMILSVSENLKKILPKIIIVLGGPEVSYDAKGLLEKYGFIDIVIRGEGEKTFKELSEAFVKNSFDLSLIKGISYKDIFGNVCENASQEPLRLDELEFVYDDLSELGNKIIYYETQRGCPYNCQYCLSSVEKGVRFLSIDRVKRDLRVFLDKKVIQVKFVDRTFNCNKAHALNIWEFLIENDNGFTNFHMEITADLLDDEEILVLKRARKGLFQFEIGVQSTNEETIKAIKRNTNFEKLKTVVKKIKQLENIHQHLDLIAGLPYEDYNSFKKSFNDVYELSPEQFQLGFLKLLKGSGLRRDALKYGIVYRSEAVYEVLFTKHLSFMEISMLKMIEEMVETYYNSGKALNTIKYMIKFFSTPFDFYESLAKFWERNFFHEVQHSKMELFLILYKFSFDFKELFGNREIIKDFLRFDIYLNDNIKSIPEELLTDSLNDYKEVKRNFFNKKENQEIFFADMGDFSTQQISRMCHIEVFKYNIIDFVENDKISIKECETDVLFKYNRKKVIDESISFYKIKL